MDRPPDRQRAFISLDIPPGAAQQLLKAVVPLQKEHRLKALRWIPKVNWHLTLAFLGDQTAASLQEVWQTVAVSLQDQVAVPAAIAGVAGFPDAKSPILAAVIEPTAPLLALQAQVRHCCESCGIALDSRRFRPHITLARSRKRQPVRCEINEPGIDVIWDSLGLYTSELTSQGSIYTLYRSLTLPHSVA
ncbi:MAG: RNA 2',3'-cyclic phosphodiesterase [Ketobacteraceae bacterium]|nr:RNA 2',3'-cyclic phosphodiesterase [Ketobacteraceae bacterium]